MTFIISITRLVLPVLTIIIIVLCLRALLFGRPKERNIAHIIDNTEGKRRTLNMWETSVGRSKACDICLEYDTVSRFHAVIARRINGWYIYDLNSKSGIKINGQTIDKKAEINNNDKITFGDVVTYLFEIEADPVVGLTRKKIRQLKKEAKARGEKYIPPYKQPYVPPYVPPQQPYTPPQQPYTPPYTPQPEPQTYYPPQQTYTPPQPKPRSRYALISDDGQIHYFTGSQIIFGRGPESNITLINARTGKTACIELYEDGSWVLSRISPIDDIRLNGESVNSPQIIFGGDIITINGERFRYTENMQ